MPSRSRKAASASASPCRSPSCSSLRSSFAPYHRPSRRRRRPSRGQGRWPSSSSPLVWASWREDTPDRASWREATPDLGRRRPGSAGALGGAGGCRSSFFSPVICSLANFRRSNLLFYIVCMGFIAESRCFHFNVMQELIMIVPYGDFFLFSVTVSPRPWCLHSCYCQVRNPQIRWLQSRNTVLFSYLT